jgi:hypothetical protein
VFHQVYYYEYNRVVLGDELVLVVSPLAQETVDRDSNREVSHNRPHKNTLLKRFPTTAHPHLVFEYPDEDDLRRGTRRR